MDQDTSAIAVGCKLPLFVYGTLKRGYSNHSLIAGARKIADGHTVKALLMMDNEEFPVVFEQGNGIAPMLSVAGELYEIDDHLLVALDQLEDLGGMYDRGIFQIRTSTGNVVPSTRW